MLVVNPGADVYGSDLQMLESVTALREAGAHVTVACPAEGPLVPLVHGRDATVSCCPTRWCAGPTFRPKEFSG